MTPYENQALERAKILLPLLQAFIANKKIEYRPKNVNCEWKHTTSPCWALDSDEYRIAPDPVFRPWKPEEVPVGAVVRPKNQSPDNKYRGMISHVDCDGYVHLMGSSAVRTPEDLFNRFETENRNPCGVLET